MTKTSLALVAALAVSAAAVGYADDPAPEAPPAAPTPPPPSGVRVGGHAGFIFPLASFSNDGTTVVGRNFVQPGIAPGLTLKLTDHWMIDLEFVAFARWNKNGALPDTVSTSFVLDPGVLYNFGPVTVGLRTAVQVGEGQPFAFGLIPIINKGFRIKKSPALAWFIELDLPIFFSAVPGHNTVSFTIVPQTGIGF